MSSNNRYDGQTPGLPHRYELQNGAQISLNDPALEKMHSGSPGQEWHPGGVEFGTGQRFKKHHTYVEYIDGCRNCNRLEDNRMHPNGSKRYED